MPAENGGGVRPVSRPRFSHDGSTVYVGTEVNSYAVDQYSYLYAIDTHQSDEPPPIVSVSSLTLNPATVTGGGTSQGTVTLSAPAPAGGAVVSLMSGNAVASVPSSVTVAAGATSANFNVTTMIVFATMDANISATYGGAIRTAALTLTPQAPPPATDAVSILRAEYVASKGQLRVDASSDKAGAVLKVYATSTGAFIGQLSTVRGGRYSGQFTTSSNPQSVTVKSSLGGSATRAVTVK